MATLQANDGTEVKFDAAEIDLIPFVKDVFVPGSEEPVDVPVLDGPTLLLVKEFMSYRSAHPFPEVEKPLNNRGELSRTLKPATEGGAPNWFGEFISRQPSPMWFKLLEAGDFLRVEDLMDLACIAIATKYNRWSDHERDAVFGELPDEEEQRRVVAEMPWVEDEPELFDKLIKSGVLPPLETSTGVAPAAGAGAGATASAPS